MTMVLDLQNVKRSFGSKAVLKGINLAVGFGEMVALYGPSGSGKSTLLNLVGAIDRPSDGVIRLAGHDVARMWEMQRTRLRRTQIGFIFQNYPLIASYSAAENIDMSLRLKGIGLWERRRRIKAALEAVGLSEHARRLPDQLSGGQQQRVAIARVLALHPTIILADEPTSGLDTRTARRVMKIFQGLAHAEGTAFLVVSHDIDLTERFVNRAYDLRDGQVALRLPLGSVPQTLYPPETHHSDPHDTLDAWMHEDDEPEFLAAIPRSLHEPSFLTEIADDGRMSEPEFLADLSAVAQTDDRVSEALIQQPPLLTSDGLAEHGYVDVVHVDNLSDQVGVMTEAEPAIHDEPPAADAESDKTDDDIVQADDADGLNDSADPNL